MTIPQRTITRDDALSLLRNAVEDRGADYVYPGTAETLGADVTCRYFADEGVGADDFGQTAENPNPPACIVGHALSQLGVTYADVMATRVVHGETNTASARLLLRALPGLDVTPEAEQLFVSAQDSQDGGYTWGDAVKYAQTNNNDD